MKQLLLLISIIPMLQGCIIGPLLTDRYVKRTSKSLSDYENKMIPNLKVSYNEDVVLINELRGRILLINFSGNDSLVARVNNRLIQFNPGADTITVVRYISDSLEKKENPFSKKNIQNILIDTRGKIIGTNVRKIEGDDQCDYYLDYSIFCLKDSLTLRESFQEYKYGMIFFYKWDYPEPSENNRFNNWLKNQINKKTIKI